ncbi:hypothetical protein [Rhodopseudomonas palustris]|uniref:hypothetical protein n=1 Tax=Rhodopseudomonas palustris TaxID=1076 RepID=UPI001057AA8C|nr:hypothetical protein [Rhodopseudomonas palustris]
MKVDLSANKRSARQPAAPGRLSSSVARAQAAGSQSPRAFPVDTSAVLARFFEAYSEHGKPISVSFRGLVSWIRPGERATHYIHPYPAKLLPQIAHFFLAANAFVKADDAVLDPFGGSGTVALETVLSGRSAICADVNPLAQLIAQAKTTPVCDNRLHALYEAVSRRADRYKTFEEPDVVNLKLWYTPAAIRDLSRIRRAIDSESDSPEKTVLLTTFSAVARKVSRADPRFSVPVRTNKRHKANVKRPRISVKRAFEEQYLANAKRLRRLSEFGSEIGSAQCEIADAKSLGCIPDESVGLVITSPPYAGAQKYVRASSLSLGWLGLVASSRLRALEDDTIGREHFNRAAILKEEPIGIVDADELIARISAKNSTRATIVRTYLNEMKSVVAQLKRILRPGGHVVLVIGDNCVCGEVFPSSSFLREIFEASGFLTRLELTDAIHTRGLMTKRAATASMISKEHIFVFQK